MYIYIYIVEGGGCFGHYKNSGIVRDGSGYRIISRKRGKKEGFRGFVLRSVIIK